MNTINITSTTPTKKSARGLASTSAQKLRRNKHSKTLRAIVSTLAFSFQPLALVFAGTNAAVMFNTNTGALVAPGAAAFYSNNPPPSVSGPSNVVTNFNAAPVTLSSNLVVSNSVTVDGNESIFGTVSIGNGAVINGVLTTGSDVSAGGNVNLVGNVNAAGTISAVGNITAGGGFYGSGAYLTGIPDSALVVPPITNHFNGSFSATSFAGNLNASNAIAGHLLGATNAYTGSVVNASLPGGALTYLPGMHNSDLVCFVEINSAANGFSSWQTGATGGEGLSVLFTNYYSKPFTSLPGAIITDLNGNFCYDAWANNGSGSPPALIYCASVSTTNYGVFACYSSVPVVTEPWDFQITVIGVQ
jgi:hypothetical protein